MDSLQFINSENVKIIVFAKKLHLIKKKKIGCISLYSC